MSSHRHLTVTTKTQEDSAIITTNLATTKPNKQAKEVDVRDCSRETHVCTQLAEGQHATVKQKPAYMFQKQIEAKEKAKRLKPRVNRGYQEMIRQETQ